ncbi:MAG: LOG family protein [Acidimicrobiales bacterium]
MPGRARTGRPEIDERLVGLLDAIGVHANRDQLLDLLATVVRLASDPSDRLDLKIANVALKEMAEGFEVFAPYRQVRKVTMFGSARTLPSDPPYAQARDLAALLAARGWSTVTGAGPGIMAAGLEGAGPDHAFGINIRLPFEQSANQFIASDPKLVSMKYFFTRKLLLIKESSGYVVLPGGFGTLDEAYELLTLLQTGKAEPAPVVLLDSEGSGYWRAWERFVVDEVRSRGLVGPHDASLYLIAESVEEAAAELLGFYRNYHSLRWVGDTLVVRLEATPTPDEIAALSEQFSDMIAGGIDLLPGALGAERRAEDFPQLPRLGLHFDRMSYARLRQLIDALNALPSAPPLPIIAGASATAPVGTQAPLGPNAEG